MGQERRSKHSSKENKEAEDGGEENEEEHEEEQEEHEGKQVDEKDSRKRSKKLSDEFPDDEIKFGEQLQDDVINSFCDKLQAVSPRKLEGLLAMQYLMANEVEETRKHVSGKQEASQVLYDAARSHYVLVHYNPKQHHVALYDSLQQFDSDGVPVILTNIINQIVQLFGHLFDKVIKLMVDKEYERQSDNFSCGYRCIGALVDLARQRDPAKYSYSRTECLRFLKRIIHEPKPTWKMFEDARFARSKEWTGMAQFTGCLENLLRQPQSNGAASGSSSLASLHERRAPGGLDPRVNHLHFAGRKYGFNLEQHLMRRHIGRPLPPSPVEPPSPPVYAGIRDFFLSVYHYPLTWKTIFRNKKQDVSIEEEE